MAGCAPRPVSPGGRQRLGGAPFHFWPGDLFHGARAHLAPFVAATLQLAGAALGARLQGKNIAVMTYIGDGGQSTGVTYEGLNFAAVQNLGLVLFVENNLWGYSTPSDMQFRVKDLAERAIAYGQHRVARLLRDPAGCAAAGRRRGRGAAGPRLGIGKRDDG